MNRPIVKFATTLHHGKPEEAHPVVMAYQCRNGLAVGHGVKQDRDGDFSYRSGWIIYHIATGGLVWPDACKTPAAAMRMLKNKFKGTFLTKLKARVENEPPQLSTEGLPEIIGKLKAWPGKPKDRVKIAPKGNYGLLCLLANIDEAISQATRTSERQIVFTIARSTFTVGASLESLQKFKASVIKNRKAFADSAFQPNQAVKHVIAAPEVIAPVPMPKKAVASAVKPVKSRRKQPQKEIGKPPVRDVWFYLLGGDKKKEEQHVCRRGST